MSWRSFWNDESFNMALTCPTSEVLRQLLQGALSPAESSILEAHLEQCTSCIARMCELEKTDTLARALGAQPEMQQSLGEDLEAAKLVEQFKALGAAPPVPGLQRTVSYHVGPTSPKQPGPLHAMKAHLDRQIPQKESRTPNLPEGGGNWAGETITHRPSSVDGQATEHETLPALEDRETPAGDRLLVPGYEILGELGRGGMGVVYKARHIQLKRVVALKMILAGGHAGERELERFRIEAEAVARLQHPGIVQIFEVGEHQGLPYFSLEFLEGGSLAAKLKGATQEPREAARLVELMARAMQAAHEAGIVHRDLKPANVLMSKDGKPKITDFGLAKKLDDGAGQTQTGAIMGTPSYMAPEQASGSKVIGPAADVYALGAILYELLTGRPPFRANTPFDTVRQVLSEEPARPSRLRPKLPRDVETICLKCLQKESHLRYPSADALADDLRCFQSGEPIRARPVSRWERTVKWVRRHPAAAAVYGLVLLVSILGGLGGTMYWLWQEADAARTIADMARQKADEARLAEEKAKGQEEIARKQAEKAFLGEQEARKGEIKARDLLARFKYATDMNLAYHEARNQSWGRTRALLENSPHHLRDWEWSYVENLCPRERQVLQGHKEAVTSVSFSPDGRWLASGSFDHSVRIWDLCKGSQTLCLEGHNGCVASVKFSPDGRRLATGSLDSTVKVWDLSTGKEMLSLEGHKKGVTSVSFSPDGRRLASGHVEKTVKVWDLFAGKEALSLEGHTGAVTSVSFNPDGTSLASGSLDMNVKVWDLSSGKEVLSLEGHKDGVNSVSFSPDGRRLASGSSDHTVKVWNLPSGKESLSLQGHRNELTMQVSSVSFSPDGRWLASGSFDMSVKVWDLSSGKEMLSLEGHKDVVRGLSFSPDGRRLASGSSDHTVRVWQLPRGKESLSLQGHNHVNSVSFSPDGRRLASGWSGDHQNVKVWDLASGKQTLFLEGQKNWVSGVTFSRDGKRLASASGDKTVKVWDLPSGRETFSLEGHKDRVNTVSFSPDGARLASGSADKTVKIWDLSSGKEALSLVGHPDTVGSVSFSPDGRWLASGSYKTVKIWDMSSGKETLSLNGHERFVDSVSFSPDGRRLASGSGDKTVKVWDLASGEEMLSLEGHKDRVNSVSFSPDGRRLASGSYDKTVKIWDLSSGTEVLSLVGHKNGVSSVAFSPDGWRLASGSEDKTVKVWTAVDTRHLWNLQEATVCEREKDWFAAAFHLRKSIDLEIAYTAAEALAGATSFQPLGVATSLTGIRVLEGRTDLGELRSRHARAKEEWKKVQKQLGGK